MRYTILLSVLLSLIACTSKKSHVSLDLIPVKQGGYWGYVDQAGKMVINPQFKTAYAFKSGVALVTNTNDKYGFIDTKGNFVVQANYKQALSFEQGVAVLVKQNQRIEFIDSKGNTQLMLGTDIDEAHNLSKNLALVQSNSKYGCIDEKGKMVIPCSNEYATHFNEGLAFVAQN